MSMPSFGAFVMLLGLVPALEASEKQTVKVYPVADLVIPIQGVPGWNQNKPACPATLGCAVQCAIKSPTTHHDALIKLISQTVKPASWSEVGGAGTIDYFPLGMGLVIRQSEDAHKELGELLDALRRLQDTEVAMEIRVVSVPDSFFFERIGVDSNGCLPKLNVIGFVDNGTVGSKDSRITVGAGLRIAVPQCTGPMPAALDFCFPIQGGACDLKQDKPVFLSEKQMSVLMEALQGDRNTNIMQAPKLTMFNGQQATIQVGDTQNFVTSAMVKEVNGQMVAIPSSESHFIGTRLDVQGVVSADRRFVAVNLKANLSELNGPVPLFPVTLPAYPVDDKSRKLDPVAFTQFIQQPSIQKIVAEKSGSIPDGGTMMFVAGKRMVDMRDQSGPPVLSKVPYINRLFKNVGYGKEAHTILICVTPRVIVSTEEAVARPGCCIGSLPGATAAALVGGGCDKSEACETRRAESKPAKSTAMNLADVVALTSSGVSDEIISNQIHTTNATFTLATEDILFLKKNKVSDKVVFDMQNTRPNNQLPPNYPPMPPQPYHMLPPAFPAYGPGPAYPPPAPAYGPGPIAPMEWSAPCPVHPLSLPAPATLPMPVSRKAAAGELGEFLIEAAIDLVDGVAEFLDGIGELFIGGDVSRDLRIAQPADPNEKILQRLNEAEDLGPTKSQATRLGMNSPAKLVNNRYSAGIGFTK